MSGGSVAARGRILSSHHSALITHHSSLMIRFTAPFSQNSRSVMARGVRRRWYLDLHGIRREGTKETGFSYRFPDGSPVTDEKIVTRIAKLRIPPAWRDVRIARGDNAPLQAVGID